MYALGGSADPTINSQGNKFLAPNDRFNKEVSIQNDLFYMNYENLWYRKMLEQKNINEYN